VVVPENNHQVRRCNMAYTVGIAVTCGACKGTGVRETYDDNYNPVLENPCSHCGGTGKSITALIDEKYFSDILDKCNDTLDKCNDILEKCDDILEHMKE